MAVPIANPSWPNGRRVSMVLAIFPPLTWLGRRAPSKNLTCRFRKRRFGVVFLDVSKCYERIEHFLGPPKRRRSRVAQGPLVPWLFRFMAVHVIFWSMALFLPRVVVARVWLLAAVLLCTSSVPSYLCQIFPMELRCALTLTILRTPPKHLRLGAVFGF